jgi:putative transposase
VANITVNSDNGTWYAEACPYLGLRHILHSLLEKRVERAIEHLKDRTEEFDDYYPCIKHVRK